MVCTGRLLVARVGRLSSQSSRQRPDPGVRCLPSAATLWWEQNHSNYSSTRFSLGPITCPETYTAATTSVQDSSTFIACCPSDYLFDGVYSDGSPDQCVSTVTAGQVIHVVTYTTITNSNEVASAWVTTLSTLANATLVSAIQMNGWNFVPTTSSSSSTTSASTASTSTQTTSSPSSPTAAVASDDTGRNIGIGVGVSLGTIGLLSLLFALWFVRRRRRSAHPPNPPMIAPHQVAGGQGWNGYGYGPVSQSAAPVYEMQAPKGYGGAQGLHEIGDAPLHYGVGELDSGQNTRYY